MLRYKLLFMPDGDGSLGGPAPDAPSEEAPEAPAPDSSVTQEEVSAAVRSLGMDVPVETNTETPENDTPDETTEPTDPATDSPADVETDTEDEVEEPAPVPEDKPAPELSTTDAPDFSFEITDANDVTFKIGPEDNLEDILKEFEPKNNGQIINVLERLREIKDEKKAYDETQAEEASKAETAATVAEIQESWQTEFKALAIADEDRREEVMKYMADENDQRQKDNRPLIRTVEHALLGLEKQEAKQEADDKAKAAKDKARENGSLVGGSSAPASTAAPVYQPNSARNSSEAIRAMGLLS